MVAPPDQITFAIEPEGGAPLQQQIRERLIHAIATGILEPGGKAPASRVLAKRLGVSRNTVLIVYQQLTAEGYLVARERSGLFVADDLIEIASRRLDAKAPGDSVRAVAALARR